jgi:hypothetical protein
VNFWDANPTGMIVEESGTLDKDGYGNGERCIWTLECPAGGIVELDFESFATEENFDYVHVMEGDCGGNCQVHSFWNQEMECNGACSPMSFADGNSAEWLDGWEIPPTIDGIDGGNITVLVTTDGSVTYGGFDASFTCLSTTPPNGGCTLPMTPSPEGFCFTDLDLNLIDDAIDADCVAGRGLDKWSGSQ